MNIKDEIEIIKKELDELFPKVPNLNAKQVATYLNVSVQCLEFWRKKSLGIKKHINCNRFSYF